MPKPVRNLVRRGKVYVYRRMVNGRLQRVSLGTDYQEAMRRLRSLKDEVPRERLTLEETAARWMESYIAIHRRQRDQGMVRQRLRDYLIPCLGHSLLERVSGEDCRAYRVWLEKRDLAPQTVRHLLADLRCMLNWSEQAGLIDRSPFPKRILPRIPERPPDRLTDEEIATVTALPEPYGFLCRFLVGTGLRWGEIVRAQTSSVAAGVLTVHGTKSGKIRRVPLPPDLVQELKGRVGKLCPFVSHGQFNGRVKKLSGIPGFHVHQLRHSFACRWLEAGGSLAALQEVLGHSTIVTTQRYGRLGEAHVLEEARRVAGNLVTKVVTAENERNA